MGKMKIPAGEVIHYNGMPFKLEKEATINGLKANLDVAFRNENLATKTTENKADLGIIGAYSFRS